MKAAIQTKEIKLGKDVFAFEVIFHRPGVWRGIGNEIIQDSLDKAETDSSEVRLKKHILDSPEYKAILRVGEGFKDYMRRWAVPALLRESVYLVPLDSVDRVVEERDRMLEEYEEKKAKFIAVYPAQMKAAKTRLGKMYDPKNYPTVEAMAASFYVTSRFLNFGVDEGLKSVDAALYEKERKAMLEENKEMFRKATQWLAESLAELTAKIADALKPSKDGKKRGLRVETTKKLVEFLEIFDSRNFENNTQLKSEVAKARKLLSGMDLEELKYDDKLKEQMRVSFAKLGESLSGLVSDEVEVRKVLK